MADQKLAPIWIFGMKGLVFKAWILWFQLLGFQFLQNISSKKINTLSLSQNNSFVLLFLLQTQELRKFTQQKSQLELMVSQITKLENDLAYQTQRADKNEVDYRMAKNKLTNLQKEKEVFICFLSFLDYKEMTVSIKNYCCMSSVRGQWSLARITTWPFPSLPSQVCWFRYVFL